MRRGTLILALVLALAVFAILRSSRPTASNRQPPAKTPAGLDVSPVCPWRNPQHDLVALFPPATNSVLETHILSRMTAEIVKRLGRQMNADENPLRIHRATSDGQTLGSVLVTRVKAEHGSIEIVVGVNASGDVKGVIIQSQREPENIAREIASSNFLGAFVAKNSASRLNVGDDLRDVPAVARASAQAIADGVRSQLIVLSFAERLVGTRESGTHTNH